MVEGVAAKGTDMVLLLVELLVVVGGGMGSIMVIVVGVDRVDRVEIGGGRGVAAGDGVRGGGMVDMTDVLAIVSSEH